MSKNEVINICTYCTVCTCWSGLFHHENSDTRKSITRSVTLHDEMPWCLVKIKPTKSFFMSLQAITVCHKACQYTQNILDLGITEPFKSWRVRYRSDGAGPDKSNRVINVVRKIRYDQDRVKTLGDLLVQPKQNQFRMICAHIIKISHFIMIFFGTTLTHPLKHKDVLHSRDTPINLQVVPIHTRQGNDIIGCLKKCHETCQLTQDKKSVSWSWQTRLSNRIKGVFAK